MNMALIDGSGLPEFLPSLATRTVEHAGGDPGRRLPVGPVAGGALAQPPRISAPFAVVGSLASSTGARLQFQNGAPVSGDVDDARRVNVSSSGAVPAGFKRGAASHRHGAGFPPR